MILRGSLLHLLTLCLGVHRDRRGDVRRGERGEEKKGEGIVIHYFVRCYNRSEIGRHPFHCLIEE